MISLDCKCDECKNRLFEGDEIVCMSCFDELRKELELARDEIDELKKELERPNDKLN